MPPQKLLSQWRRGVTRRMDHLLMKSNLSIMRVRLKVFLVYPPNIQSVCPTGVDTLLQGRIAVVEGDDIESWEVVLHARLEGG